MPSENGRRLGTGRDRTGDQVGALTVLGRDEENPRRWRVRWSCCRTELTVGLDYILSRVRTLPTRCRACVIENQDESERARKERERKQALRDKEEPAEEAKIYAGGLWWGPALGKLGPR